MTTFVYYFIPEDNENENKMNIFIIYKTINFQRNLILNIEINLNS